MNRKDILAVGNEILLREVREVFHADTIQVETTCSALKYGKLLLKVLRGGFECEQLTPTFYFPLA